MAESATPRGPLVTVVMPVYNAAATLGAAVRSILDQTYTAWEMLLVDDGSTDGSLELARSFASERVSVRSDGLRLGVADRLNAAIAGVHTQYVCRMDADDIAFPARIERQVAFLEQMPGVDVVASSVVTFKNDGTLGGIIRVPETHEKICAQPWRGFYFPHPSWLGRTEWFKRNPYRSSENGAEDQGVLYRAHAASTLGGIPDVLLAYREEQRTFSRLFQRRVAFWRAVGLASFKGGRWRDSVRVSIAQPVKIIGDALNTSFGLSAARNRLEPVPAGVLQEWSRIVRAAH